MRPSATDNERVLGWTSGRDIAVRVYVSSRSHPHLLVLGLVTAVAVLVYARMFQEGLPPGVDSATFLHFAWFVQKALQGQGGLVDTWWYGGFSLFKTYPPLAYSLTGLPAYVTHLDIVVIYKVVLLVAYIGLGMATYWLAMELRTGILPAAVAAVLVITAYPVISSIGLWGRFSSMIALPLGVASFAALERASRLWSPRTAVLGGVLMGLSILAHHMTAFALALVLIAWCIIRLFRHAGQLRRFAILTGVFAASTGVAALWWIVPFLFHAVDVGFEREVPGLWDYSFRRYVSAVLDASLIGMNVYPSYVGFIPVALAVGGTVLSILKPSKATAYGAGSLVLLVFSLGQQVNPLIRVWPFDGLDVARFFLFLTPFAAVLGAFYLSELWQSSKGLTQHRLAALCAAGLILSGILAFQVFDGVRASKSTLIPFRVGASARASLDRLREPDTVPGAVLGIGWWNWDSFLVPRETGRPVMDGWYDEGTPDWRAIREVRHMMWSGSVDVPRLYELMGERGTAYVTIYQYYTLEHPEEATEALRRYPDLFREVATWEDAAIFQRLPGP